METRVGQALVVGAAWLAVVLALRASLQIAFRRYERRLAERDPAGAARRRTTFAVLLRVVVVVTALIGVWSVLSVFPTTQEVAHAFLASGAVLALLVGVALTTPLSNLGSGVLLAFTQPVRFGDRIEVAGHTGIVDGISLSYTALTTDEGQRIFVPNSTLVSSILVNRSPADRRKPVGVSLPVQLGAPLADARRVAGEAASRVPHGAALDVQVRVGELTERTAWLEVVALAPAGIDAARVASDIREHAVGALGDAGYLA